ncbi:DUF221-domain-containing protein [Dothidotthia symphoricarpi CBS 119687]|uniref:DUF221-domain-containing protein n=1 Tax=Dothidotthia symphoricarpi CBS 119687 TaxID=1392245 RepID=A0A6A6ASS5_9PLEO|nr:DUF221-domain-containing protein [Dothidotthia symphoricarpi CBS 119687]KAF2134228.1 DUF221-domain-containing protein [Dothidotthia symphoricarpi CBS 119687]
MIEKNNKTCTAGSEDIWGKSRPRDVRIQIYFSLTLGLAAFLAFCILRPRWKGLYAARKKQNDLATALPELPDSLFGWIIPLWKITDEQVLASAGLDAYVYLAFFKMAIKFLLVTLFFALAVIKPVHDTHQDKEGKLPHLGDGKSVAEHIEARSLWTTLSHDHEYYTDYLWMYLVFVYLFTALILYLIVSETRRIIDIRQEYLGSQTTITDRTIRLSGIPLNLRSEDKIKEFIEDLGIGQVESVTVCRDWKELDDKVVQRHAILRKLEEAWTVYLGNRSVGRSMETLPIVQPHPPEHEDDDIHGNDSETGHLLNGTDRDPDHISFHTRRRPTTKLWYGRFKLRYHSVDAINYYEEQLRTIDDEIKLLRKRDFKPTPLAFVTMDSVASAQMAIQAVLDPSPLQLLANTSPAPSDVVWSNTYLSRSQRIFRSWSITFSIGVLSIFWTVVLVPIAGALNTCSINEVFPGLAAILDSRVIIQSLVNTQLPTLALSLINVLVPFLYDWLANNQGMISQGDVELSVISKNFFFTFFNFFIVFTILGTASGLVDMLTRFGEKLTSATEIAYALARSLSDLLGFYTNFIILQGFGLFPFRLLEFGALSLYPVYLIGAKTPRDYAELVQPPVFSYGFFLPQTILIFIICMVYSVLRDSWQVLLTGLAYFMIGHFVHKYQLLYAMEHRQHSTGRGWTMMCDRVIVGVILFQVTVAGQLALKKAFRRAILIAPLVIATLWFLYVFSQKYRPLMEFIALRSLRNPEQSDLGRDIQEEAVSSSREGQRRRVGRLTLDEARERGLRFVNPSLILPSTKTNDSWFPFLGFHQHTVPPTGGATTTSSQIHLSRGVAGTKSESTLPVFNLEPLQVTSCHQSSATRRLSLSPHQLPDKHLMYTSKQMCVSSQPTTSSLPILNGLSTTTLNDVKDSQTSYTKRSEVLRYVFPRPSRNNIPQNRQVAPRVTKLDFSRHTLSSTKQSRPRTAFHRAITSFFGNNPDRNTQVDIPLARSRTSSFGSKLGSSAFGSVPSLDFVSTTAFLFSGPSLHSAGSFSNSTSRLPSLMESRSQNQSLRREYTGSFSMLDNISIQDEGIIEPVAGRGIIRTMPDVLMGVDTPVDESETLLLRYLDTPAWKALRLTSRAWHNTLNIVAPPKFPASYRLPFEIVQQVYGYLGPKDFNAARHTCRNWMGASLNKSLLIAILKRGGWSSTVHDDLEGRNRDFMYRRTASLPSDEWILSRYISRECTLSSGWTGNGMDIRSAIVESAETDFSEMAKGYTISNGRESGGLIFTTSICGHFLLVARDALIYIYDLRGGSLVPVTSVVCPRRVLSMSMDVSSGRNAVATLLEGRMGMVCELRYGCRPGDESLAEVDAESNKHSSQTFTKTPTFASHASEFESGLNSAAHVSSRVRNSTSSVQERESDPFDAIDVHSSHQEVSLQGANDCRTYHRNLINQTWNLDLHGPPTELTSKVNITAGSYTNNIPVESGTSTFYRHLCSEDDPPRSVSICPQRRCVAFGCSAGIELHWIDALTGQSLSRWFPLTAPSDYLYFLSPRPGFESAKKLRLISSAAHPDDRPAISRRFFFGRPTVSSFWGSFGFESNSRRSPSCDHYHAIPLSDGHHVLFVDPPTGKLSLGCDAPLGGPTKLLRKVLFIPPEEKAVPRTYIAAADMSWGARVVVVYGDTIMLYSVPPDVCKLSQLEQKAESRDPSAFDPTNRCEASKNIWPIAIRGTEIGKLPSICELAIQTQPNIQIWAFTNTFQCKVWRLHNYIDPVIRSKHYIRSDGLVYTSHFIDEDRDIIIRDAPSSSRANVAADFHVISCKDEYPRAERCVIAGFDGNASGVLKKIPKALAVENDAWVDFLDIRGCSDAWFEENGDVMVRCGQSEVRC